MSLADEAIAAAGPHEVARVRTPLADRDIGDVLACSYRIAFGGDASPARLACAWALNALETGHGHDLWCNNFGNVTAGPDWKGNWWTYNSEERFTPTMTKVVHMHFRAHDTAEIGATDWWRRMAQKYAPVLAYFDRGDAAGAAVVLHGLYYFTGDMGVYARSMASLFDEWMRRSQSSG